MKEFSVYIWHMCSLGQNILLAYLVAVEMLLPWQQGNFTRTLQNESILSSYLAHVLIVTIYNTDLPGCYGNTVTRDESLFT